MAAIVGIDDTDSRTRGMCTTYLATLLAEELRESGATVAETLLVRLAPSVEYKTRGNAALAIHTDAPPSVGFECARELVEDHAATGDDRTHPGVVVAPHDRDDVPPEVASFARAAMHEECALDRATELVERHEYHSAGWGCGRGRIGALAAVGADAALSEWTYERIGYRPIDRWGTERVVDRDSVFDAAETYYPAIWDTVDRVQEEPVCVPRTPGPVLFGIRGEGPRVVRRAAAAIEHEPLERIHTFRTNQGTDAHLWDGTIAEISPDRAYRLEGVVVEPPETRAGGHVFMTIGDPERDTPGGDSIPGDSTFPTDAVDDCSTILQCVAFEPTKRFRDRVRSLRAGDRLTVCGEVSEGTLKLEKFAVRRLLTRARVTPDCPTCGRTMESAGADQGYRCRECSQTAPSKVTVPIERSIEPGWYEVPPCARRHVARPLARGGFDAPVHPER
jgi:tRNA(Ile2)-agmatinylcytidine synthase